MIERGIGFEINTSGLRQTPKTSMPGPAVVRWYADRGGRLITTGTDSHAAQTVGAGWRRRCTCSPFVASTPWPPFEARRPRSYRSPHCCRGRAETGEPERSRTRVGAPEQAGRATLRAAGLESGEQILTGGNVGTERASRRLPGGGPLRAVVLDVDPLAHGRSGRASIADGSGSCACWIRNPGARDRNWADRRHGPTRSATLLADDAPGHDHSHAGRRAPGVGIACSVRCDLTGFSRTAVVADAGLMHHTFRTMALRRAPVGPSPGERVAPVPAGSGAGAGDICAPGSLDETSALSMLGEACLVAGVWIFAALLAPANWRPMAGAIALGTQFVVLWMVGQAQ